MIFDIAPENTLDLAAALGSRLVHGHLLLTNCPT